MPAASVVPFGAYPAGHSIETTVSSPPRALFAERTTRLLVMWLLAFVLPLQGAAVALFATKGPAHLHKIATTAPLVLEDLRRWKPAMATIARVTPALGHVHASAVAQRHHHARDDGSVVRVPDDTADADEALGASAAPSMLALIPAAVAWGTPERVVAAHAPPWDALKTRYVSPLDRPPRNAA